MGRVVPLTDSKCKKFKAKDKPYSVADGDGLYLWVYPSGKKSWRVVYRINGKYSKTTIGSYPAISLKEARMLRDKFILDLQKGKLPYSTKNLTFKELKDKYIKHRDDLNTKYLRDINSALDRYFSVLYNKDVNSITAKDVINCIESMVNRGLKDSVRKNVALLNRIFRYGVTLQLVERNIVADIDISALQKPYVKKNFPHITDQEEFKRLVWDIYNYYGDLSTKWALQILLHTFVRPANVRFMEWSEIDLKKKLWIIPAEKMKAKREHIVPLTKEVIRILKEIKKVNIDSRYVFVSKTSKNRAMSDNTLNMALKRMGWGGKIVPHGFRHTASTFLNEYRDLHGVDSSIIELQLAHSIKGVAGVYNKAVNLRERRKLMKWWSRFILQFLHIKPTL